MDDEILLPDRCEAIAAMLLHALGKSRRVHGKLQLGPIDRDQLRQFVERQHAFDQHDAGRNDVDVAGHESAQRFGHAGFDLQPDDRSAAASLKRAFVKAHEVFRLLLDLDVAVADDSKGALAQHFVAWKQQADERDDQSVERHKPRDHAERTVGQPHEPLDAAGDAHERAHRSAVLRIEQLERQREAEIGDEGKRMRRIDRQRRQDREDMLKEVLLQPVPLAAGEIGDVEDDDAAGREFRPRARAISPAATPPEKPRVH